MDEIAAFINRRGTDAKTIARILREEFKIHYNKAIRIFTQLNVLIRFRDGIWMINWRIELHFFRSNSREREREKEGHQVKTRLEREGFSRKETWIIAGLDLLDD